MVNTRRMESSGSAPDSGPRYHTRRSNERATGLNTSSESESEIEESQEEDSWSSQGKKTLPARVRELRSRFVCGELKYSQHHSKKRELRSCHKRISLDERHTLTVYSHKMHEDSDIYNENDLEDELYSSRAHRSRHLRHSKSHLSRIERRTALSLRPISLKSYADPHSPMNCNSEDSDVEKIGVRRSTRKKKVPDNMSWLADDQMHKVGYPNLDSRQYSEEDSRDAQDHTTSNIRRSTRHSHEVNGISTRREIKKSTKYLYDYETEDIHNNRRKSRNDEDERDKGDRPLRTRRESNDKENKEMELISSNLSNGRVKRERDEMDYHEEDNEEEDADTNTLANEEKNEEGDKQEETKAVNAENKADTSESEEGVVTRRKTNRLDDKYSPRRTRNRKISESSSSSEVGKVYSLRERPPKLTQKSLRTRPSARDVHSRRRFNHRRNNSSSSSSGTSSDSEDRCRKVNKYNKTPKSLHSKNEQPLKSGAGASKLIPIRPETLDSKVRFSSVGGLDSHVQCLKEMVLLPMMYPEVFKRFQIQPPRGVLFHGPPGTGKTLIARALANECSFGSRKVSFFMRKGADLLSKWIGESEKQLRLLFEQASEMKPSIIFFDELDGLAPVRSSRQDQVHASIVSTLLALMDGLDNRGEVIVIGATNRIDAIDPALRRPGRFDRELFFPLPARKEREEILNVQVAQWAVPPSPQLLSYLAEHAVGYCGSDLRALCSEAVIQSFRRTYPQVYSADFRLLLDPECVKVEKIDFLRAKSLLVPASHRVTQTIGRKLLPMLELILLESLKGSLTTLEKTFPHGVNPSLSKVKLSAGVRPAQLLLTGDGPDHGQTTHLAPAILFSMEHIHAHLLDLASLYRDSGRSPEEACIQVFHEVRRNIPSILYIPNIDRWWSLISETVRAIFISQLMHLDPNSPILLLATSDTLYHNLPEQIREVFSLYRKEVFEVGPPDSDKRRAFFLPLIIDAALRPPRPPREKPKTPPPLAKAPTPPLTPLSEEVARKLYEQEERTLRELRIFLRDMCKKLANNKLFYMFTKPVDTEEVPDYTEIIKQPMDLETMMTKVDFHRYECAKDFLDDIELICQNALEYNPAKSSADKQIRHRACSLRDYAYTLIKNEMDSDFEEKCQEIAHKRKERKASITQYLPAYINTPADNPNVSHNDTEDNNDEEKPTKPEIPGEAVTPNRIISGRKRKIPSWQRGYLSRKKPRRKERVTLTETVTVEENNDNKPSSEDEPKVKSRCILDDTLGSSFEENQEGVNNSLEMPSLVNASFESNSPMKVESSPLQSPNRKRRLSDLMSPSELLDDPLDFDDVDQALNETVDENTNKPAIEGIKEDLEKVLDEIVITTVNESLHLLLDLHYQLSRIIRIYARSHDRRKLPTELRTELGRYKRENIETAHVSNESSS